MKIKCIIFDLDNTLYDENTYFFNVFRKFSKISGVDFYILERHINESLRFKSPDIFKYILETEGLFTEKRHETLFEIYKSLECRIELYPDAFELINYLKKNNYKIGVLTNGVVEAQKNKAENLRLTNFGIDVFLCARTLGRKNEKPSKAAFHKITELSGVKKEEVLFVGDHPFVDIKGALDFGMEAVRLMRGYAKNINFQSPANVYNLNEIKKFLK